MANNKQRILVGNSNNTPISSGTTQRRYIITNDNRVLITNIGKKIRTNG